MNQPIRVHVGVGKNYLPGWINIDLFSTIKADIYADMAALPLERGSIDCLYVSHALEHCQRHTVRATLSHWRDLLKPNGLLRLAVPDFGAIVKWYNQTGRLSDIMGLLYGGQNHPRNHHFIAFDCETLTEQLQEVGFSQIRYWDWRTTEHAAYDDYSQAYLPHLNKDTGLLVSLNLEAVK